MELYTDQVRQPDTTTQRPSASERTRDGIIHAAIDALARESTAAMSEVATAAGVSRSTLHRHFADRSALLAAINAECRKRFDDATIRARPDEGSGLSAIDRISQEYLELGPVLSLIFTDNAPVNPDNWEDSGEQGMAWLITRGQQDGSIDPQLPGEWLITTIWVLLFGAWQVRSSGAAPRDVMTWLSHTLSGALSPH